MAITEIKKYVDIMRFLYRTSQGVPLSVSNEDQVFKAGVRLDRVLANSRSTLQTKLPDNIRTGETELGKVKIDMDILTGLRTPPHVREQLQIQTNELSGHIDELKNNRSTLLNQTTTLIEQHKREAPPLFMQYAEEKIQANSALSLFAGWMKTINGTINTINGLSKTARQLVRTTRKLTDESALAVAKAKGAAVIAPSQSLRG